jgi:DNA-binding FadR family transcriptional regulator
VTGSHQDNSQQQGRNKSNLHWDNTNNTEHSSIVLAIANSKSVRADERLRRHAVGLLSLIDSAAGRREEIS